MPAASTAQITGLLQAWSGGDTAALERLTPMIYGDLRRMARRQMQRERPGDTLQATALVHEAFLRLVDVKNVRWQDRAHFFAIAGQMMRRILVEAARARGSAKRGGGAACVNLDESIDAIPTRGAELIRLDEALDALAQWDPRKARVIELRFFSGLNVEESAEILKISPRSVMRDWSLGRAWLIRELSR
jgi:RNA polymerase sigma factor (TIGR02999 family)